MLPFLYLIIDLLIVLFYVAAPWVVVARLNFEWPEWLKDGIVVVIVFVMWTGLAKWPIYPWYKKRQNRKKREAKAEAAEA